MQYWILLPDFCTPTVILILSRRIIRIFTNGCWFLVPFFGSTSSTFLDLVRSSVSLNTARVDSYWRAVTKDSTQTQRTFKVYKISTNGILTYQNEVTDWSCLWGGWQGRCAHGGKAGIWMVHGNGNRIISGSIKWPDDTVAMGLVCKRILLWR